MTGKVVEKKEERRQKKGISLRFDLIPKCAVPYVKSAMPFYFMYIINKYKTELVLKQDVQVIINVFLPKATCCSSKRIQKDHINRVCYTFIESD